MPPKRGPVSYLYSLDLGATHAPATIHQKQQLSGGFVKFCRFTQQDGTEVQHQDGAAQNVLVVSLPHKLQLQEAGRSTGVSDWGLLETPGEGNASEHQPSFRAPNLFERSG